MLAQAELIELTPAEAQRTSAGNGLPIAVYLSACFRAGFEFGYEVLGPRLFG